MYNVYSTATINDGATVGQVQNLSKTSESLMSGGLEQSSPRSSSLYQQSPYTTPTKQNPADTANSVSILVRSLVTATKGAFPRCFLELGKCWFSLAKSGVKTNFYQMCLIDLSLCSAIPQSFNCPGLAGKTHNILNSGVYLYEGADISFRVRLLTI